MADRGGYASHPTKLSTYKHDVHPVAWDFFCIDRLGRLFVLDVVCWLAYWLVRLLARLGKVRKKSPGC
jgi:hypothetical protein